MPNFKHPAYVRVEDADIRKELIEWLENTGYTLFRAVNKSSCDTVVTNVQFEDGAHINPPDYFVWSNDMVVRNLRNPHIDCGTNIDLFKAIAAINNENDYMQWFYDSIAKQFCFNHGDINTPPRNHGVGTRKATPTELIEHFKNK